MHYNEYKYMRILLVILVKSQIFIFVLLSKNFIQHVNVCLTHVQFFAKHAQVTVQMNVH